MYSTQFSFWLFFLKLRHFCKVRWDLSEMVVKLLKEVADCEIKNRVLREEVNQAKMDASFDALTGLLNRKAFDTELAHLVSLAGRVELSLTLVMTDIDKFKNVNDQYGHQAGDKALQFVAKTIADCVRGGDVVGRYGGEEFVIILPNTTIQDAEILIDRLRKAVERNPIVVEENSFFITASFGIAAYKPEQKPEELLKQADLALYDAKRKGRNQICIAA